MKNEQGRGMKVGLGWYIYPILIFVAGCSFGPMASIGSYSMSLGWSALDVTFTQYLFGWLTILVLGTVYFIVRKIRGKKSGALQTSLESAVPEVQHQKLTAKTLLSFFAAGIFLVLASASLTLSLRYISPELALLLLFQFAWLGVLFDCILTRRLPSREMMLSVLILLAGTVMASGFLNSKTEFDLLGIIIGFMSGLTYAVYLLILGHVKSDLKGVGRSFLVITSAFTVVILMHMVSEGTAGIDIASAVVPYGVVLGAICCGIPAFFIAVSTPKVSTGAATVLSSSELPASIICTVVFLGNSISYIQWIGIAVVLAGIAMPYVLDHIRLMKIAKKTAE